MTKSVWFSVLKKFVEGRKTSFEVLFFVELPSLKFEKHDKTCS